MVAVREQAEQGSTIKVVRCESNVSYSKFCLCVCLLVCFLFSSCWRLELKKFSSSKRSPASGRPMKSSFPGPLFRTKFGRSLSPRVTQLNICFHCLAVDQCSYIPTDKTIKDKDKDKEAKDKEAEQRAKIKIAPRKGKTDGNPVSDPEAKAFELDGKKTGNDALEHALPSLSAKIEPTASKTESDSRRKVSLITVTTIMTAILVRKSEKRLPLAVMGNVRETKNASRSRRS
jgi:hypothetical protein